MTEDYPGFDIQHVPSVHPPSLPVARGVVTNWCVSSGELSGLNHISAYRLQAFPSLPLWFRPVHLCRPHPDGVGCVWSQLAQAIRDLAELSCQRHQKLGLVP